METSYLLPSGLSFSVIGSGPEHVLFLAGMCLTRDAWHPQVSFFARDARYTLIMPDNRGVGRSALPPDGFTIEAMASDAWAVLDAVGGLSARAHLVGHSMGAMIAARAALQSPSRTRSLALLSAHAGGWWWSNVPSLALAAAAVRLGLAGTSVAAAAAVGVSLHYSDAYLDEMVPADSSGRKVTRRSRVLERYVRGAQREREEDPVGNVFWGQLEAVRQYAMTQNECETLRRGPFKVVVLYGEDDPVVTPEASRELAEKTGAARICVRGKHFIADESSRAVNVLLRALFRLGGSTTARPRLVSPMRRLEVEAARSIV